MKGTVVTTRRRFTEAIALMENIMNLCKNCIQNYKYAKLKKRTRTVEGRHGLNLLLQSTKIQRKAIRTSANELCQVTKNIKELLLQTDLVLE